MLKKAFKKIGRAEGNNEKFTKIKKRQEVIAKEAMGKRLKIT